MLANKRVLFICTPFHEFPDKIKEAIESVNGNVDLFLIEKRSFLSTFLLNINHNLYKSFRLYQQNLILKKIEHINYDIIFIQYPFLLSHKFFKELKSNQSTARFINYNWDSIKSRDYTPFMRYFDKVFSFDSNDCLVNPKICYLPLFYAPDFDIQSKTIKKYDLVFIGGIGDTKERYEFIRSIEKICLYNGLRFKKHMYCSKNFFIKSILKGKIHRGARFKRLKLAEIASLYHESNCVLDYHNDKQKGLSMRTFEALGSGCKLITTNKNILSAEFMNPEMILIIDKNNPAINKEFIFKVVSKAYNFGEYSLKSWIKKIFSIEE